MNLPFDPENFVTDFRHSPYEEGQRERFTVCQIYEKVPFETWLTEQRRLRSFLQDKVKDLDLRRVHIDRPKPVAEACACFDLREENFSRRVGRRRASSQAIHILCTKTIAGWRLAAEAKNEGIEELLKSLVPKAAAPKETAEAEPH